MNVDMVFSNPPYEHGLGGIILDGVKRLLPLADYAILMPFSCYKQGDLIKYVDTDRIEVTGNVGFDAKLPDNTVIASLNQEANEHQTYKDVEWRTYDKHYMSFYVKNFDLIDEKDSDDIYVWHSGSNKKPEDLDIETDFIEIDRCNNRSGRCGHGKKSGAYLWNVVGSGYENKWFSCLTYISFKTPQGKKNFSDWWYAGKLGETLATKLGWGLNKRNVDKLSIPQINWETIDKKQHHLWSLGHYDAAVLAEMNLGYEDDKETLKDLDKTEELMESIYSLSHRNYPLTHLKHEGIQADLTLVRKGCHLCAAHSEPCSTDKWRC